MRLCYLVLVTVSTIHASATALPATAVQTTSKAATPLFDSEQNDVSEGRFLRIGAAVTEQIPNAEERLGNIDLILKDAAVSVKRATKWKAQFMWWKLNNKEPKTLANELKITDMGHAMRAHPQWKKLRAYQKYYGEGPLKYP